jgi:hypothetical protein
MNCQAYAATLPPQHSPASIACISWYIHTEPDNDNWGYFIWELALALVPNQGAVNIESRPLPAIRDCSHDGWFVYIWHIIVAGNSISSQLGSSSQGNRYGTEKAAGTARPSRTKSHLPGHSPPARRDAVLGQPSGWILIYMLRCS